MSRGARRAVCVWPTVRYGRRRGRIRANQHTEVAAETNDRHSQLQDGVSLLQFTPTVEDEGKFLVCRAENPKLPEASIEDRWKLRVHCKYRAIVIADNVVGRSEICMSL